MFHFEQQCGDDGDNNEKSFLFFSAVSQSHDIRFLHLRQQVDFSYILVQLIN